MKFRKGAEPRRIVCSFVLLCSIILSAITASAAPRTRPPTPPAKIHQIQSSPDSAHVNAYVIETASSLVLVDTLFTTTDARTLLSRLGELKKPLAAIIVTHPHPDHYNNLAALLDAFPGVPVYADPDVTASISSDDISHRNYWQGFYPGVYPERLALPTHPLPSGARLTFDGVTIETETVRKGESAVQSIVHVPTLSALITGDLVMNRVHPSFRGSDSAGWIDALTAIEKRHGGIKRILPGHGAEGGIELVREQKRYIERLRDEIRRWISTDPDEELLSPAAFTAIGREIVTAFPYVAGYNVGSAIKTVAEEIGKTIERRRVEPFMY